MDIQNNVLHLGGVSSIQLAKEYGTPLYVYEKDVIEHAYNTLAQSIPYPKTRIYYACKANANPTILTLLKDLGAGVETVSVGEVQAALAAGFDPQNICLTSGGLSKDDLRFLIEHDILVHIDSLSQLKRYGSLNPGGRVSLRINGDIGAGHHEHVVTGGVNSKFGIHRLDLTEAQKIAQEHNLTIIGLHQHIGSNVLEEDIFVEASELLLAEARAFPDLEMIDFGGGFGIPYMPSEKPLDIAALGTKMAKIFSLFCDEYGRELTMMIEPGHYLVGEAGTLLAQVMEIKKNPYKTFVEVDTGFNHLIRPAMYGSYHKIVNASRMKGDLATVTIAGNICESGDILGNNRELPKVREGDIIAIRDAGAYGYSMSSHYNLRAKPAEILVHNGTAELIRERL